MPVPQLVLARPVSQIVTAAVAIALVLSLGETRLYHDKFNFSSTPASSGACLRRTIIHSRKGVWAAIAVAVGVAAVWLAYRAIVARGFDWGLAAFAFTHVRVGWLLLALVTVYATYWGRALRWAVFLRPLKAQPSAKNLLSATVVGFTAITLLGRAGEFVRPYLIAVKERVPVSSQLAAWVLERIFDTFMALLLFGFALSQVSSKRLAPGSKLRLLFATGGQFALAVAVALLLLLIVFRHFGEPAKRWIERALGFLPPARSARIGRVIATFLQGVESTRSDAALLTVFLYSILEWVLIVAAYWFLATSFPDIHLTIVDLTVLMGFVSLGAAVQIPGIGGGVQVAAVLVLTELFGVRLELATAFAFFSWILTFVAIVPAGLLMALKEGLDWHKLRSLARETSS